MDILRAPWWKTTRAFHEGPTIRNSDGLVVCDVMREGVVDTIVAAPKMLAALKVTHEYNIHIAECPETSCAKCDELFKGMLQAVPEAIAEAEGAK